MAWIKWGEAMLNKIINESKAYYCVECRKCSSLCPVSRVYNNFSPASIVERCLIGIEDEVLYSYDIWKCLSCKMCEQICPTGVSFTTFIKNLREIIVKNGNSGIPAHEGFFEEISKLMLKHDLKAKVKAEIDEDSKIIYFAGCLPIFDVFFEELEINAMNIAESTVRILNKIGITPSIVFSCCGHDALWNGRKELFDKIVKKNVDNLKDAEKIIFSCPECYSTFKFHYPELKAEMMHISELLGNLKFDGREDKRKYTFHDSCRLGRHLGLYEEPRKALENAGIKINEMEHNKEMALCCGTSAWMCCDWKSEDMRRRVLEEASLFDVLITSCPKCKIHFKCALTHEDYEIEIKDFVEVIAERIK